MTQTKAPFVCYIKACRPNRVLLGVLKNKPLKVQYQYEIIPVIATEDITPLVEALKKINHSISNIWEWQLSDPEDSDMDRDQQIGNWCEMACDQIKEALATLPPELRDDE